MNFLKAFIANWRATKAAQDKKALEECDARERAEIARHFNDRYTYRKKWKDLALLPSPGMYGLHCSSGYAWMCPECNSIHHPTDLSGFSGLQYPACCRHPAGHRLNDRIKTSDRST